MESGLREHLSNLTKQHEKIKENLTAEQNRYIEERIKVAKTLLKKPKTPTYIDEHKDVQIGNIMLPRCAYCNDSLEELREPTTSFRIDPKIPRNVERYCSKSCMIQHSKMKRLKKRYNANTIVWGKNEVKLCYNFKCNNPKRKIPHYFEIRLPTRKTRADNYKG